MLLTIKITAILFPAKLETFFLEITFSMNLSFKTLYKKRRTDFIAAVITILKGYKITTVRHPLLACIESEPLKGFFDRLRKQQIKR